MSELNLTALLLRQEVIKLLRRFFDTQGFQEVTTPILNTGVPLEPRVYPFTTTWHARQQETTLYLPIYPERDMKRLLGLGLGECYTIGHCCRNLEASSPTHHPEFLMLEWYRRDCDDTAIRRDTKALFTFVATNLAPRLKGEARLHALGVATWQWQTLSVAKLWQERLGVPLDELLTESHMARFARRLGYQTQGSSWEENFQQIFFNEIETQLPQTPFFLLDFPARLSPHCARQKNHPDFAARFEVYYQGLEIGNGNSEYLDEKEVGASYCSENQARCALGMPTLPADEVMLTAIGQMKRSGHNFAGIGIGVERLTMILAGIRDIGEFYGDFSPLLSSSLNPP